MMWMLAAALLAQAPQPSNELPPGHPVVSSPEGADQLPPGHPPLGSAPTSAPPLSPEQRQSGALPPGHPPMGSSPTAAPPLTPEQESSGQMPPGHPGLGSSAPAVPGELPAGHPQVNPNDRPMSSSELLKKLDATADLRTREKTFEVASALGKLYYANSRFPEAVVYLRQALQKTEPARALYLDAKRKAGLAALPSPTEAGCAPGPQSTLDSITDAARERAKAGKTAQAAACAHLAVDAVVDAEHFVARALFLTGDSAGALAELDRAVALDDHDLEVSFLRGAVRLDSQGDDVKALHIAKADFDRVVSLAPQSPRAAVAKQLGEQVEKAIAAGGITQLDLERAKEDKARPATVAAALPAVPFAPFAGGGGNAAAPALSQDAIDAVRNTEKTPELMQGMQKLVEEGESDLAQGRYQEALDAYKRVVPFQPENGRAKAGMAWALVGLGKPMADRVWMVAVQADPSAVDKLGETLKSKGDEKGAKGVWQKLSASDPSYAQRAGLARKL
jgi:tetratricopeptide (TPR) repeat protein